MKKSVWIYRLGDIEYGPFTAEEIWHKIEEGTIDDETMIKGEGYTQWEALKEIKELHMEFLDVAPPITKHELENHNRPSEEHKRRLVRPWVRFWARMMDYSLLYFFILGVTRLLSVPPHFGLPLWGFLSILSALWIVIEAGLLHLIGTTPGKWFLQIHLQTPNKKKASYGTALLRSFTLWWRGLGGALPFISLAMAILSYISLANNSITAWDRIGGFDVVHKRIGFWRTFFTALYFFLFFALFREGWTA